MSGELQPKPTLVHAAPLRPVREIFAGSVPVFALRLNDGSKWIAWPSVQAACRGDQGLSSLSHKTVPLVVELDGKTDWMRFVSCEDFFGQVLICNRFPEFVRFASEMLGRLETQGVAVLPDAGISDDPDVILARNALVAILASKRAEREAREAKLLAAAASERLDDLGRSHRELTEDVAGHSQDIQALTRALDHGSRYVFGIPYIERHGVNVPRDETIRQQIGRELVAISHELGDHEAGTKERKRPLGGMFVNTYLVTAILAWIERNRAHPQRRHWFTR